VKVRAGFFAWGFAAAALTPQLLSRPPDTRDLTGLVLGSEAVVYATAGLDSVLHVKKVYRGPLFEGEVIGVDDTGLAAQAAELLFLKKEAPDRQFPGQERRWETVDRFLSWDPELADLESRLPRAIARVEAYQAARTIPDASERRRRLLHLLGPPEARPIFYWQFEESSGALERAIVASLPEGHDFQEDLRAVMESNPTAAQWLTADLDEMSKTLLHDPDPDLQAGAAVCIPRALEAPLFAGMIVRVKSLVAIAVPEAGGGRRRSLSLELKESALPAAGQDAKVWSFERTSGAGGVAPVVFDPPLLPGPYRVWFDGYFQGGEGAPLELQASRSFRMVAP
jgi:hypothetical protein